MLQIESRTPKIYGVSELTEAIKQTLEDRFEFVWLEGEISNFSAPLSGHYYMALKDAGAQIRAVMFRLQARYLRFTPENGMKVIAQGRIGIYPQRGEYQLILDYLEPMGAGALAVAFEQLKKRLAEQGVFDEKIKKPLPFLPQRVAVITSPTGAAVRDFLKIVFRRFANIEIIVVPVRVQGEGAAEDIVRALKVVNRDLRVDVIVLTRGGGSLEDLWAFNQEVLALAIRDSEIPVVSAVGHEIDLTISDLAADFRAPTPSAAAELLVAEKELLCKQLEEVRSRLVSRITTHIRNTFQDLGRLTRALGDPRRRLSDNWMRLDDIYSRLTRSMQSLMEERKRRLDAESRALMLNSPLQAVANHNRLVDLYGRSLCLGIRRIIREKHMSVSFLEERVQGLNPLSVLKRGYSVTRKLPEGTVLRNVSTVKSGDWIHVLLAEGAMECRVERVNPDEKFKGSA